MTRGQTDKAVIEIHIPVKLGGADPQYLRNLQGEREVILNAIADLKSALDVEFDDEGIRVTVAGHYPARDPMWSGGPGMPYGT